MLGCYGSIITASQTSQQCLACPDKELCHQSAKETLVALHGKFTQFPMDDKGKKGKKK